MPSAPQLSRRAALALGTAALLTVSGCTGSADPTSDGGSAPVDPDQQLLDRVVASITETAATVTAAQEGAPALRHPTRHLARMHEQHLAALDAIPSSTSSSGTGPAPITTGAQAALDVVRRREQRLQRQLSAAALQAESGALARLLASMGAAVSQAVAALPQEVA